MLLWADGRVGVDRHGRWVQPWQGLQSDVHEQVELDARTCTSKRARCGHAGMRRATAVTRPSARVTPRSTTQLCGGVGPF